MEQHEAKNLAGANMSRRDAGAPRSPARRDCQVNAPVEIIAAVTGYSIQCKLSAGLAAGVFAPPLIHGRTE
jgi:hypothetical protein